MQVVQSAMYSPEAVKNWQETDVLIIDEASLMSKELFEQVCKEIEGYYSVNARMSVSLGGKVSTMSRDISGKEGVL